MKKNIAIVTGGSASELSISLKSAEVVFQNMDKAKYECYKVILKEANWEVENENSLVDKNDFSFIKNGTKVKFDAAFVALHGTPAEDGKLQGYFELLKIPYNCCGVLQASLTFDKNKTKEYLRTINILSPSSIFSNDLAAINSLMNQVNQQLSYPVFVKPNKNGSSYGASKVDDKSQLEKAIKLAFEYDEEILIEEYIQGTEVTCGVMIYKGKVMVLPITEIRSSKSFFDFQAKYEGASQEITPAEIDKSMYENIQKTVLNIYKKLEFKGMCRIDFIIRGNEYFMLEVNSIPGISAQSIIPQQAQIMGISLQELFTNSVDECLKTA